MDSIRKDMVTLRAGLEKLRKDLEDPTKKNSDQTAHIETLTDHNVLQDHRLKNIEETNTRHYEKYQSINNENDNQDKRLKDIQNVNGQHDYKLDYLRREDAKQNSRIAALQSKNLDQDVALDKIRETNANQDKEIKKLVEYNDTQDKKIAEVMNSLSRAKDSIMELVKKQIANFTATVSRCIYAENKLKCLLEPTLKSYTIQGLNAPGKYWSSSRSECFTYSCLESTAFWRYSRSNYV